ncbi:MAG: RNA methyltransferase [Gammaproteobacteria bacterium]|nr:RNA methyltransferase [Gammaproteobacteria bacterium]
MNKSAICIVLVNTSHPGNIGAVARAMKNMGLVELRLVAPARFPAEEANWRAVAASDVLESALVVDTLAEAIGDCQLVIGTSARGRRIPWPVLDPRHCAEQALRAAGREQRVAFVFGREDRGLTNEELQQCNLHLHIPTHEDYTSLNLAMAVQIVAYELRMQAVSAELPDDACAHWDEPLSTAAAMEHYYKHLEQTLIEIGFLDPAAPRQLMPRLRRLYGRLRLDEMEMNILRGILTETQKRIRT